VPIEQIARLVGHSGTSVTEQIYRHQLRPVLEGRGDGHGSHLPDHGGVVTQVVTLKIKKAPSAVADGA
jgi:hypothetical protein